jgi:hypothetical protein
MTEAPEPGQWWSIEVMDGAFSAEQWRVSYGRSLFESAVTHGAVDWTWRPTEWGIVLEVEFRDGDAWQAFRQLPAVQAALDAVPDPDRGLFVFPGRGGSSDAMLPRRPRPNLGAGGAALPVPPEPEIIAHAVGSILDELERTGVPAVPVEGAAARAA